MRPPYKKQYTKPLPANAEIITKQGVKYARYKSRGHTKTARLAEAGDKILLETKYWHLEFIQPVGDREIRRHLKAYPHRRATEYLKNQIEHLLDCSESTERPAEGLYELGAIQGDIRASLIKWGLLAADTGKPLTEHIADVRAYLLSKERTTTYIKQLSGQLTNIFDGCNFVVWPDIKAEALKSYLDELRDGGAGISKRHYNGLLSAVKFFCTWMVKQQRATTSPIQFMDGLDNQQTDPRHARRVLSLDDFRRFLEAAQSGPMKYKLSGPERCLIYRLAAETGLRSVDIRRLRVKDFDFAKHKITIEAGRIKNKQESTVYLKPATSAEIKQHCQNKLAGAGVFRLSHKASLMVKFDLDRAGIPYIENGLYFDFHALRHMTASLLGMNPDTTESVRQEAMRHKTPKMTRLYTHTFEEQQRQAILDLPDLTQPSRAAQAASKTGTDGKAEPESLLKRVKPCAQTRTIRTIAESKTALTTQKTHTGATNGGTKSNAIQSPNPLDVGNNNDLGVGLVEKKKIPADLQAVVERWGDLPEGIRAAISKLAE